MLGDHPEHEADFGEPVILRSEATCMSGFLPLGRGKIFLTGSRLLWYSNAGILNMPFSLWRSSVEIPLAEIDEVTSLVTRSLRVKSRGGLYGFSLTQGSQFNPLFILNGLRASRAFKIALAQQVEVVRSAAL